MNNADVARQDSVEKLDPILSYKAVILGFRRILLRSEIVTCHRERVRPTYNCSMSQV